MRLETKEHKQRLIDCFVNAVYLYDDKLVITFNYKEATKTVSLKEVNGSIIECTGVPKIWGRLLPSPYFYTPWDSNNVNRNSPVYAVILTAGERIATSLRSSQ